MATTLELAALSAYVYNNERGERSDTNTLPVPPGWIELRPENGFTAQQNYNENFFSFTAGAFLNQATGEIVIAYKGTDFLLGKACKTSSQPRWREARKLEEDAEHEASDPIDLWL